MALDRNHTRTFSDEQLARLSAWSERRPCVTLMGEFSAGKSTLLNFLIEDNLLPTRATATELPPVWFTYGSTGHHWVTAEGDRRELDLSRLDSVPRDARYIRIYLQAEVLEHCDVIDTPGISDPNLATDSWRFAAGRSDMILWCTSATQAWRETERATWVALPERLRKHSVLVVTRADKLLTDLDKEKVARRMIRETNGLFSDMVFMATPDAVRAKADLAEQGTSPLWEASGAGHLLDVLAGRFEAIRDDRQALLRKHLGQEEPEPVAVAEPVEEPGAIQPTRVTMPTRPVRPAADGTRRTERPSGEAMEQAEDAFEGAEFANVRRLRPVPLPTDQSFVPEIEAAPAPRDPLILRDIVAPTSSEGDLEDESVETADALEEARDPSWAGDDFGAPEEAVPVDLDASVEDVIAEASADDFEADEGMTVEVAEVAAEVNVEAASDESFTPAVEDSAEEHAAELIETGHDMAPPEDVASYEDDPAPVETAVDPDDIEAVADAVDDQSYAEASDDVVEAASEMPVEADAAEETADGFVDDEDAGFESHETADADGAAVLAGEPQDDAAEDDGEALAALVRSTVTSADQDVGQPQGTASLPQAVALWRAIVAGRDVDPANQQMVEMIDELLMALGSVQSSETSADAQGDAAATERSDALAGWRRLA